MNLENIMPSEEARHKRSHFVWIYFYDIARIGKYTETERLVFIGSWGRWEWEVINFRYRVFFWSTEKVLKIEMIGAQHVKALNATEFYI